MIGGPIRASSSIWERHFRRDISPGPSNFCKGTLVRNAPSRRRKSWRDCKTLSNREASSISSSSSTLVLSFNSSRKEERVFFTGGWILRFLAGMFLDTPYGCITGKWAGQVQVGIPGFQIRGRFHSRVTIAPIRGNTASVSNAPAKLFVRLRTNPIR